LMYVRRELQERLTPPIYGWHNVNAPDFVSQEHIEFRKDARKYEAGTHNLVGLIGLIAGMKLILEVGVENISAELLRKRAFLVSALRTKGYSVLNADEPSEVVSGIVSCFRKDIDLPAAHQKLTDANIVTSLRVDRSSQRYIRLSPHFYITDDELQRTVDLM
jgi:cysteine desulfurase / selenocysteine lyase